MPGGGGESVAMRATDHFHAGIVVDDVDSAMDDLAGLFGYEWCQKQTVPLPVRFPTGERTVELTFTYSSTVPRLELIATVPGTFWAPIAGIHHFGYWSDDVARDSASLVERGYAMEVEGIRPDGSAYLAYYRKDNGLRVELVSRELEPGLERYWALGHF